MSDRPRLGISACLLGEPVRYDGAHKRDAWLVEVIGPRVEWVAVCPEVEVGMGTPREPIELVAQTPERLRLVGVNSGKDWTDLMQAWADNRIQELSALGLSGYIFKARSPSCGIGQTPGLFALAVMHAMPDLPIADEDDLSDAAARMDFLKRVLRTRRSHFS